MPMPKPLPALSGSRLELIDSVLGRDRRVLLTGPPGIGKSTLANGLALALEQAGRDCWCIGADPGSPLFGIPGAVCLGRWQGGGWKLARVEALCTLDAGRFRLPLVRAVQRLAQAVSGMLLVDSPGVVRGVAGAELFQGIAEAAAIELVLVLEREGRPLPLEQEISALRVDAYRVPAADEAQRPGKGMRARQRSRLWDAYLTEATEQWLDLAQLPLVGTPPPLDAREAWKGRQLALLNGGRTQAMGEVVALHGSSLRVRLPAFTGNPMALLVRDAQRLADGRLGTAAPFLAERLDYLPRMPASATSEDEQLAQIVGRAGMVDLVLVNGVFGDPLLHVRLRHQPRSLLFDLGEGSRLSARAAHQVSDVFITHAHADHIAGFVWFLRSRIGDFPGCRIYGPPGLSENIAGMTHGILWDRIGDRGPRFEVCELHGEHLQCYLVQGGLHECAPLGQRPAPDGLLLSEAEFRVRAERLDHATPVLAFAFEPAKQLNVRKDRLAARGFAPGPWLGELKRRVLEGQGSAPIRLPDGGVEPAGMLAEELLLVTPGKKLVYATDFADSIDNRRRLIRLARGAHTFFCESTFREADAGQAARTAHLTTRACGEIAEAAGVARLVPFHFSRRYEHDPEPVYAEIAEVCSRVVRPQRAFAQASDLEGDGI